MKVIIICTILVAANAAFLPRSQGKYSECDKGCPFIYLPVCGVNEKGDYNIYANDCVMDVENCKLKIKNEAIYVEAPMTMCNVKNNDSVENISNCNLPCPDNYDPVCAYDGHGEYNIFATECMMNVENCNRKTRSEIAYSLVSLKMCENNQQQSDEIVMIENEDIYKHCIKPCLDNYNPICGYDGHGEIKIFANECDMEVQNCRVQVQKGFVFMQLPLQNCDILDSELTLKFVDMQNQQQSDEIVMIENEDIYKDCIKPCLDNYNPICGYDGHSEIKIFANECDMEVQNCRVQVQKGFVFMQLPLQNCDILDSELIVKSVDMKKNCNKICTADYNPVCGYNGIEYHTFGNQCDFESQNCESNYNWRFTRTGECDPTPTNY